MEQTLPKDVVAIIHRYVHVSAMQQVLTELRDRTYYLEPSIDPSEIQRVARCSDCGKWIIIQTQTSSKCQCFACWTCFQGHLCGVGGERVQK